MLLAVFVIIVTIFILQWHLKRRKVIKSLESLPGPKGYPLIGSALEFRNKEAILPFGVHCHNTYGPTIKVFLGTVPFVKTIDPELIEFICGNQKFNTKSMEYKFLNNWLGQGLLTSAGDRWKSHRRILTPSFHYKILEEFIPVFDNASKTLVEKLQHVVGKDSFNLYNYITLLTLDIICDTAMGTPIDAQKNPNSKYVQSIKDLCQIMNFRITSPFLRSEFIYKLSALYKKEKSALDIVLKHSRSVINRRKSMLASNPRAEDDVDESLGIKKKHTFMDVLLKGRINGDPLTEEDIREEVDTFMFEGHDTTAIGISFVIKCIADHPIVQQNICDELKKIFGGDRDRPATYNDLQEMKYLEMVIKEGLRLYPSVPAIGRQICEDIPYKDLVFQNGQIFIIAIHDMHRNSKLYPDPEKFDPERFTLQNSAKRHPFAYIPFSAGFRNCIGQKFAMLEIKSAVSKFLRHFKVYPTIPEHKLRLVPQLTLFSKTGIRLRIEKR